MHDGADSAAVDDVNVLVRKRRKGIYILPNLFTLAALFGGETGDDTDKLSGVAWTAGPGGVPLLDDCPVRLVGRIVSRHPFGDHEGFLLEPLGDADVARQEPLLTRDAMDVPPGHPV